MIGSYVYGVWIHRNSANQLVELTKIHRRRHTHPRLAGHSEDERVAQYLSPGHSSNTKRPTQMVPSNHDPPVVAIEVAAIRDKGGMSCYEFFFDH